MALFSILVGELRLFLMAGEQMIKMPSANKAPVDKKGCKFAKNDL